VKALTKKVNLKKNQTLQNLSEEERENYILHYEIHTFYQHVKDVIAFLTGSSNRAKEIHKNTQILNGKPLKLVIPTEVRFLSFYQSPLRL